MRQKIQQINSRSLRGWAGATCVLGASLVLSGCHIDMWQQPKMKPYYESDFFADRQANRPLVPHTVAQGGMKSDAPGYFTGFENGKIVAQIPVRSVKAFASPREMLNRGQDRYNAYCQPCHGKVGDGNGFITQRGLGYWQKLPASYHTDRLRKVADGHIYDVITNGYGVMYGYSARVQNVDDRWAIVAYVRALQLARTLGTTPSVPTAGESAPRGNAPSGTPELGNDPNQVRRGTPTSGSEQTERPINRTPGGEAPNSAPAPGTPGGVRQ